jgi:hypothetical protein
MPGLTWLTPEQLTASNDAICASNDREGARKGRGVLARDERQPAEDVDRLHQIENG